MWLKLLILSVISLIISAENVRYDNFTLFRVTPHDEVQLRFLRDLYNAAQGLDFWKPPTNVGDYVSVVSPPELRGELEHKLNKRSIHSEIMLENIQEAFDSQVFSRRKRDASRQLFWDNYQTLDQINDWFDYLAETHSNIVTLIDVGRSYEGRTIRGVRISRGANRPRAYLHGGDIGADWISPVVLTYIIDQLVAGDNPEVRAAAEQFEWHIVPVTNPDGFLYTNYEDRLWVKNRRQVSASAVGIDLSKNWNSQWGVSGGSFVPSANNYIGLGPFSEPETRSISSYVESIGSNLSILLDFRAFGQQLLIPFAHTEDPMYNYEEMVTIGRRAMGSLAVKYDTRYNVGVSKHIHDGATGAFADWVKYRFNPPVVATYLLRDTGAWGYTLPSSQVKPTCEETFDSFMAIIREAKFINVLNP